MLITFLSNVAGIVQLEVHLHATIISLYWPQVYLNADHIYILCSRNCAAIGTSHVGHRYMFT